MSEWVSAFAPASIGNVAVGFDMLGLALDGVGDRCPEALPAHFDLYNISQLILMC